MRNENKHISLLMEMVKKKWNSLFDNHNSNTIIDICPVTRCENKDYAACMLDIENDAILAHSEGV
jgi:hypothetical protein